MYLIFYLFIYLFIYCFVGWDNDKVLVQGKGGPVLFGVFSLKLEEI